MILDLFAGPGGWDEGAAWIGRTDTIGLEWDAAACRTAKAAGHLRVRCDVAAYSTAPFTGIEGLIASPPCQAWSMAGKRKGEQDRAACHDLADRMADGDDSTAWREWEDDRSPLVCQPVRWVRDLQPSWVALEEVPAVASLWEHFARIFRAWGYGVWTGDLNAANYGVPQTRTRRILMARKGVPVQPPAATHARDPQDSLFGRLEPWVSMAQALGWDGGLDVTTGRMEPTVPVSVERPAPTFTGKSGTQWVIRMGNQDRSSIRGQDEPAPTVLFGHRSNKVEWYETRPATTVVGSFSPDVISPPGYRLTESRQNAEGGVRVTVAEGGVLQSFPPDYPWDGLAPAPHVAQGLSVEDHFALLDQLKCDSLKRGVDLVVVGRGLEDDQILQSIVGLGAVDVVDDLLRLRPGDHAVLRHERAPSEDVAALVDPKVCGLLPALVRIERVTVKPPLLPVSGAPTPSDGFAFTVLARRLGGIGERLGSSSAPDPLVMHEAHALGSVGAVATFNLADPHVSCYRAAGSSRTKQYQQVGNAIPPLLAAHILTALGATTAEAVGEPSLTWREVTR